MGGKCEGKLRGRLGTCERSGTVVRDGKWYCKQHDPEALTAKARKDWAQRRAWIASVESQQDARIARRQLLTAAGLDNPSDDLLRLIADLGGIETVLDAVRKTTT